MKQPVKINHMIGPATTATIVIDKNGLSVIDKSEYCSDSKVCKAFITQLIDMGSWNYSWHIDVSNAQRKGTEERKSIKEIMQKKILEKELEIQQLKNGIQILGRWNIYTQ